MFQHHRHSGEIVRIFEKNGNKAPLREVAPFFLSSALKVN